VLVGERAFLHPISRELRDARERAAAALESAGARVEHVGLRGLRRALELFLTVLANDVGVSSAQILTDEGCEPVGWRGLVKRDSPHTVATRVMLAAERVVAHAPARRTRRVLAGLQSFEDELAATIGDGVLLFPPLQNVAPRHGRTVARPWWLVPQAVFNLAGLPVTEVPLGLGRRGLPLGVQVAAGPGRDHVTIAAALELERAFGGWVPPPTARPLSGA
jgi:fatty acid amide hydrolase 2